VSVYRKPGEVTEYPPVVKPWYYSVRSRACASALLIIACSGVLGLCIGNWKDGVAAVAAVTILATCIGLFAMLIDGKDWQ